MGPMASALTSGKNTSNQEITDKNQTNKDHAKTLVLPTPIVKAFVSLLRPKTGRDSALG